MAISIQCSELLDLSLWGGLEAAPEMSSERRTTVGDELADVMIYGLSLANVLDIDLSEAIVSKLKKDEAKYPADRFRGRARCAGRAAGTAPAPTSIRRDESALRAKG